jgi:hypothetical protein
MKITKTILIVTYLLSVRFGFQETLKMNFPDTPKLAKKYRKRQLTEEGKYLHNWR